MAKLVIKNLAESKELDRNAMKAISGGMIISSVGSFRNGGWGDVSRTPSSSTISSIPYPTDGVTNTTRTARKETTVGLSTTGSDDGSIISARYMGMVSPQ